MLSFASICPHPPIIIPEIGGPELSKCQKTVSAMKKLADYFRLAKPDTVIVITPHGLVQTDRMTILAKKNLQGSFWQFGHPEIKMEFDDNPELAQKIKKSASDAGIATQLLNPVGAGLVPAQRRLKPATPLGRPYNTVELDHGVLVPMYHLCRDAACSRPYNRNQSHPTPVKLIPTAFSYLPLKTHFQFGKIIGRVIKKTRSRIALVASGDLSHRLTPDAPAGFSPRGQEFDQKLIDLLKKNDVSGILNLDEELIEAAGECGLRSIIIFLGVLSYYHYQPQILSYQGPFGVGYLVANFEIRKEKKK